MTQAATPERPGNPGTTQLAVSIAAASPLHLAEQLAPLDAEEGADAFYVPVADGHFVPWVTGDAGVLRALKERYRTPVIVHLMTVQPERQADAFLAAGADTLVVHAEAATDAHGLFTRIREAGASPVAALNPATPLTRLNFLLPLVDAVLLAGTEPAGNGAADTLLPVVFDRVRILSAYMRHAGGTRRVAVTGAHTLDAAAQLVRMGAETLVLDAALLGTGGVSAKALEGIRRDLRVRVHRV